MESSNPYAPPTAPVRDMQPEDSAGLAGRGARLGAWLLDGLVMLLLVYTPMFFFIDPASLIQDGEFSYASLLTGPALLAALPGAAIYAAVTIVLVLRNGQSIGKKLVGIKVVRSSGDRAGLGRIFWLRNVVLALVALIPIIGNIVALVDALLIFRQSRKCLHDQIADTIVIQA